MSVIFDEKKSFIGDLKFKGTVVVTPAVAAEFLKKNLANRRLNRGRVDCYSSDMAHGSWDCITDGRSLTFDDSGNLLNGQHRLAAIVKSGVALEMFVFEKTVKSSAMSLCFDTGLVRSASTITGKSTSYIGLCRLLIRVLGTTCGRSVSISEIENFESKLDKPSLEFFAKVAPFNKKGFSSGVKAGVILYSLITNDWTVSDFWEAVVTNDYTNSKAMQFADFCNHRGGYMAFKDVFAIQICGSYGILDGKNAHQYTRDAYQQYVLKLVKDFGKSLGL